MDNYVISFLIRDGITPQAQAQAHSRNSANIFITATTLQEAKDLLPEGEALALKLMNEWTPGTGPQDEQKTGKHYAINHIAEEDLDECIEEYTHTARGRRFLDRCEKARAFRKKKEGGTLRTSEFKYIYALANKNLWEGLTIIYDIAFRMGYNKAIAERKQA